MPVTGVQTCALPISVCAPFQVTDVAVVRQNLWPEREIGRSLEDHALRGVNNDRVASVHGDTADYAWRKAGQREEK